MRGTAQLTEEIIQDVGPAAVGENDGESFITANHLQTHTDDGRHPLNNDEKTKLNRDDHLYIGTFNGGKCKRQLHIC